MLHFFSVFDLLTNLTLYKSQVAMNKIEQTFPKLENEANRDKSMISLRRFNYCFPFQACVA